MINFNRQCLHKTHAAMDTMTLRHWCTWYIAASTASAYRIGGDVTSFRRDEWFSRRKLGSVDLMSLVWVKSQGKTITSSAVCHDSKTKKSIRQSFFNFQENLNEYLPDLDVEAPVWLEALERFHRHWQMAYFGHFLTLFQLKRPAQREKNTSNMADVRRWRHHVTSLQVLYRHSP
jgi:hypothetical protein